MHVNYSILFCFLGGRLVGGCDIFSNALWKKGKLVLCCVRTATRGEIIFHSNLSLLIAIPIKRLQVERMSSSYPDECENNYLDRAIQYPIDTNPGLLACTNYTLLW